MDTKLDSSEVSKKLKPDIFFPFIVGADLFLHSIVSDVYILVQHIFVFANLDNVPFFQCLVWAACMILRFSLRNFPSS